MHSLTLDLFIIDSENLMNLIMAEKITIKTFKCEKKISMTYRDTCQH
jgi:hypothetical protein